MDSMLVPAANAQFLALAGPDLERHGKHLTRCLGCDQFQLICLLGLK
jgi:hypothetical protein